VIEVRRVRTAADREAAYAVRIEVFVGEQGVPLEIERDDLDEVAEHVLALRAGRPVGTGRMVTGPNGTAVVGRVAVRGGERGQGTGQAVMDALEQVAHDRGCAAVELHAQLQARGFYERLGYRAFGPEYDEAGIRHVSMRKPLPP
jgi:predicted GNAT family N-acyltransferase